MNKLYFIVLLLVYLAFAALAQPEVVLSPEHSGNDANIQIGLPFSGQVQSNNGYILQFGIMEEAISVPPTPTTTTTVPTSTTTTTITATTTTTTVETTTTTETPTTPLTDTSTTQKPMPEPAPEIKVWFDNRLYQSILTDNGNNFIISKRPKIKVEFTLPAPYALSPNLSSFTLILDKGSNATKTYRTSQPMSAQTAGFGTIEYVLSEDLVSGTHTFSFTAGTAGTKGIASYSTQSITAVVKAGAVSVLGEPIHFPSPFSPSKNKDGLTLQYTLSENADVEIYVFNVAGETVKRISCLAGTEGGIAGLNKIRWNGTIDGGGTLGNGIYVGTIVSKKEGKLLAKFKINVFD
ncbi:MAG: hypothetical protein WCT39_01730 [Candidatus Margulisiibacteriota bacterium]